jgi:hypothetical protein
MTHDNDNEDTEGTIKAKVDRVLCWFEASGITPTGGVECLDAVLPLLTAKERDWLIRRALYDIEREVSLWPSLHEQPRQNL